MKKSFYLISLILVGLVGISAFFSGIELLIHPDGSGFGLPLELLEPTPFPNYVIPGVLLILFLALPAFYILFRAMQKKEGVSKMMQIYGFILILWLSIELLFNPAFFMPSMHITLYIIALLLIITPKR